MMRRILIVAEDDVERSRVSLALDHENRVAEATSGLEGLRRATAEVDLIVADLPLPDLSQEEFIRGLRRQDASAETPLLVLLPESSVGAMDAVFAAGASAVLPKPWQSGELQKQVERLLEAPHTAEDGLAPPKLLREAYERARRQARPLGDVAEVFGGVMTRDPHRFVADVRRDERWRPMLTGRDIHPFHLDVEGTHVLYQPRHLLRVPPPELVGSEKVVLRRNAPPLQAAVDDEGYLISESVYGVVPAAGLRCGYLAALFNSRLLDYYTRRVRPLRSEPGVPSMLRQSDLEELPIRIPSASVQAALADLGERLARGGPRSAERGQLLAALNRGIFEVYGFGKREVKRLGELNF
jgi:CheY-like chemotaxis protein